MRAPPHRYWLRELMRATCQHHSPGAESSPPTTRPDLWLPFTPQTYLLVSRPEGGRSSNTAGWCWLGLPVWNGKLGLTNSSESFRLLANWGLLLSSLGKSGPSKLDFCLIRLSFCALTLDLGEQQMVLFLGHLNSSLVSALPKQVKER